MCSKLSQGHKQTSFRTRATFCLQQLLTDEYYYVCTVNGGKTTKTNGIERKRKRVGHMNMMGLGTVHQITYIYYLFEVGNGGVWCNMSVIQAKAILFCQQGRRLFVSLEFIQLEEKIKETAALWCLTD